MRKRADHVDHRVRGDPSRQADHKEVEGRTFQLLPGAFFIAAARVVADRDVHREEVPGAAPGRRQALRRAGLLEVLRHFVLGADRANELRVGISQQAQRIGIERNVRPIFLTIARDAVAQLASLFSGLDAHAKNLDLFGNIPFGFIDKGRHLGPAPRSPAAAVKEDHGRRRSSEDSWKFDGRAVNVFEFRGGKSVADLYLDPINVVDNRLMIIVQKGNPKGIHSVQDLTRPGLRIGLPHHEKSAMGNIAWKMLVQMNLYDALSQNLKVESPTGDFLLNQIRAGSLDAIIACRSSWAGVRDYLDAVPIDHPLAALTQPYAVGRGTRYGQMMARLRDALTAASSRERFEAEGFGWVYRPPSTP